jgi:hypothetical protein
MSIAVLLRIELCFFTELVSTRGLEVFETDVENHPWNGLAINGRHLNHGNFQQLAKEAGGS